MTAQNAVRREVARLLLDALADTDFVLTGASALLEHGLIDRPTEDVDLFSTTADAGQVPAQVDRIRALLDEHGAHLDIDRSFPDFASGTVSWKGHDVPVDLGIDWRGRPPVITGLGPVLDIHDSIGSKVSALYGRREDRDYMDVAAILLDGRWSADDIIVLGIDHEPSVDLHCLAQILDPEAIPTSGSFRDYLIGETTESRMRTALTTLRRAALGTDADCEALHESIEERRRDIPPQRP